MNLNGGAEIINKHSGKLPKHALETGSLTPQVRSEGVTQPIVPSPLASPGWTQKQGGIEIILQEAVKGVYDQGEKLGINQVVRGAVGELKKNVQDFQSSRTCPDVPKWNLEEDLSISSSKSSTISSLNNRHQQLAHMLDQTIEDLRKLSVSGDKDVKCYISGIEIAMAKVDFVRIYLQNPALSLPEYSFLPIDSHSKSQRSC